MLNPSPPIMTIHGLVAIIRYIKPLWNIVLAVRPMIPIPRPVCMKVSFRYALSYGGIPPSSRVSRLKITFIAIRVPIHQNFELVLIWSRDKVLRAIYSQDIYVGSKQLGRHPEGRGSAPKIGLTSKHCPSHDELLNQVSTARSCRSWLLHICSRLSEGISSFCESGDGRCRS